MKKSATLFFVILTLIAISCKKESSTLQSSSAVDENFFQNIVTDVNEPGVSPVRIGKQVWTNKNLTVGRYRNGDKIPQVTDAAAWKNLKTGAWCWYNNDSVNGRIYGKLYNWYAVHDPRGLAPEGWHIPGDTEWTKLSAYLGGIEVAGGKMKSIGTIEDGTGLWHVPNADASNSSRFTGLPGGFRFSQGTFDGIGYQACWWSSTEHNAANTGAWFLLNSSAYFLKSYGGKFYGFSIRCIKD